MTFSETQSRILDTAESLFADRGFTPVSLRMITGKAGVNLASVHYHFGSKDKLIEGVIARLARPINEERLRMLDTIEERAGGNPPDLLDVLTAFYEPPLRLRNDPRFRNGQLVKILGRLQAEPREKIQSMMRVVFAELFLRFSAALSRSLPHLPAEEVVLRMQFGIGSMIFTLLHPEGMHGEPRGEVDSPEHNEILHKLVDFTAAGLRAPAWRQPIAGEGDVQ